MASDDDSSSSGSDDDFLTLDDSGNKNLDRDALVRKKLLESFYGKSAVAAAQPSDDEVASDEDLDDDGSPVKEPAKGGNKSDWDAPNFDAQAHTRQHVLHSNLHTLLETEEKLALQVRTLDSTMQTLVYENYSRFIDATDAIRSIGVNVQANQEGIQRLTAGMQQIDDTSRATEEALGDLRDQVAEKIRVKRLLTRLDALLKLPKTLQEQIATGKCRTATRSYLSASLILRKHSEGFESLKTIETECNGILSDMRTDLKNKLLHWSGRLTSLGVDTDPNVPDPPKNMTEIFECAGTLYILWEADQSADEGAKVEGCSDDTALDADDLQSMAVSAVMRLLDRLLDTHLIEVQERRFTSPSDQRLNASSTALETEPELKGSFFIPRDFLDAILEAATLYGMSFGTEGSSGGYLVDFVSEAFASGISHIRSVLLEESVQLSQEETREEDDAGEEGDDAAYGEITGALSIYVQSVRELATGLTLPEVGINPEFASNLVDQAMELTESMLRRRVDQKFYDLRLAVVQNCLIPFAERAMAEKDAAKSSDQTVLPQIVQLANSTLSDCLQLVDDTMRSTFSSGIILDESSTDLPILKDAVEVSSRRFASWLASSLERLAGGESSDPKDIIEASMTVDDETEGAKDEDEDFAERDINASILSRDDMSDMPGQDDNAIRDMVDKALKELLSAADAKGNRIVHSDFILALAEMCRLAERSVADNLDQSIATHVGGSRRSKSRSLFPSGEPSSPNQGSDPENEITKRFHLAASRILTLYATNLGADAAVLLCQDVSSSGAPSSPRSVTWEVLAIVKASAMECADIFGGSKRAGPVPEMEDDAMTGLSSQFGRKTGLQLDIERMFKEKVSIYPHPSETMAFSRNAILFLIFKVAFRPLIEKARMSSYSADDFSQLQVDTEFLKHMVPHYVSGDSGTSLSNLLADVMTNVGERCTDESCAMNDDLLADSRGIVRSFLANLDAEIADKFIINGEEEE